MTISILMLILVIAMAYWWGAKGAFNAFIQMVLCTLCGALALGIFEPLGKLINPNWGPGVALLAVFGLSLILLRIGTDRLVQGNLHLNVFASWGIGVVCGAWSGVITGGIIMIGIYWMPMVQPGGYQPYISSQNAVARNAEAKHFFPVDRITAGFYNILSNGSLNPLIANTLDEQYPDMIKLASSKTLHAQRTAVRGSASRSSLPAGSFSLERVFLVNSGEKDLSGQPTSENTDQATTQPAENVTSKVFYDDLNLTDTKQKLYYIDLNFSLTEAALDKDGYLRISAAQIWLISRTENSNDYQMSNCVAYIQDKTLSTFSDGFLWTNDPAAKITLVFAVDQNEVPQELIIKHTRKIVSRQILDQADNSPPAVLALYDRSKVQNNQMQDQAPMHQEEGFITYANRLPFDVAGSTFTTRGWRFDTTRYEAITMMPVMLSAENERKINTKKIRKFKRADPRDKLLQVRLNMTRAKSLLGNVATRTQRMTTVPYLIDDQGEAYAPVGWAMLNSTGKEGQIFYDVSKNIPFRSLNEMKFKLVKDDQQVLFYYSIPTGTKLVRFQFKGAIIDNEDNRLDFTVN